jgi:thiamine-phosphate pyrophosphorylase
MHRRQPLPRLWLMTDERQGDQLWNALRRLPRGAGIVFRHYGLPLAERRKLFDAVKRRARARGQSVLLAGPSRLARSWGAAGSHDPGRRPGLTSSSAHSVRELRAAEAAGARFVFVSPVFPTDSHPGARVLGQSGFARIARQARIPVIALGGVDASRARGLKALGAYGWAAINAWTKPARKGSGRSS